MTRDEERLAVFVLDWEKVVIVGGVVFGMLIKNKIEAGVKGEVLSHIGSVDINHHIVHATV